MNTTPPNRIDDLIDCEICLKEIPISELKSEEAVDYITHYCGLECYEIWKQQKQSKPDS